MGRCLRKCRGTAEVAVVGVTDLGVDGEGGGGVRTRARALAMAAAAAAESSGTAPDTRRIRNFGEGELRYGDSLPSSVDQLGRRRRAVIGVGVENNLAISSGSVGSCVQEENCPSGVYDDDDPPLPASCSSSNAASIAELQLVMDPLAIPDPEEDETAVLVDSKPTNSICRKRRETTPSTEYEAESGEGMDSTAMRTSSESNNSRLRSTVQKMPSDFEIEEFFAAAEKDLQKRFIDKYNFDIVKDVPLEGRYQWVPLKP
ncbi:hypothetical protein Dimus_014313 [Dionaea muscipula]